MDLLMSALVLIGLIVDRKSLSIHIFDLLNFALMGLKRFREIWQFVLMLCCCVNYSIQFMPNPALNGMHLKI